MSLASASQREAAASLGVEKALNERLKGKDDQIAYLREEHYRLRRREGRPRGRAPRKGPERIVKIAMDAAERDEYWQKRLADEKRRAT